MSILSLLQSKPSTAVVKVLQQMGHETRPLRRAISLPPIAGPPRAVARTILSSPSSFVSPILTTDTLRVPTYRNRFLVQRSISGGSRFQNVIETQHESKEPFPPSFVRNKYRISVSSFALSKQAVLAAIRSGSAPNLLHNIALDGLDTARACGEDAVLVCSTGDQIVVGCADGVGGWAEYGVDPGIISHRLLQLTRDEAAAEEKISPVEALSRAFSKVRTDGSVEVGSTTVCLGFFRVDPVLSLSTLNIGDSGFVVFRPTSYKKVVHVSTPLQHFGGAPFQLAVVPQDLKHLNAVENTPNDGFEEDVSLAPGDIVVFGSDGLFDNLLEREIESTISKELHRVSKYPELLPRLTANVAKALLHRCIEVARKLDDISVVVAHVDLAHNAASTLLAKSCSPTTTDFRI